MDKLTAYTALYHCHKIGKKTVSSFVLKHRQFNDKKTNFGGFVILSQNVHSFVGLSSSLVLKTWYYIVTELR